MIDSIASVVIPVSDPDAALRFYTDSLGFTVRADFTPAPGMRWIELGLPGSSTATATGSVTAIALATPRGGMWRSVGGDTNISLGCSGIVDEHKRLRAAGVDVDEELLSFGEHVPRMFRLLDSDGNILQVVESR